MLEQVAYASLVGAVAASAFSLPLARMGVALGLVTWICSLIAARRAVRLPAVFWLSLLFAAVASLATLCGVRPELGMPKLRKLIWFLSIAPIAALVRSPGRLKTVAAAYAIGCGVLALRIFTSVPIESFADLWNGAAPHYMAALIAHGSMTDAQRLMVGVLVTLGLLGLLRRLGQRRTWWWLLLGLQLAALLLMFKRGSWLCTLGFGCVLIVSRLRRRYLLMLLVLPLLAGLPPVRQRFVQLKAELSGDKGGRMTMWFEVAPRLVARHPWGMGYRSLTNADMREIAPSVEANRDHLHSNIVQILVATGWLGLSVYLVWMGWAVADGLRFAGASRRGPPVDRMLSVTLLLALLALLANGLVEYNFGDSELVLVYGWLMGTLAGARAGTGHREASGLAAARCGGVNRLPLAE